MITLYVNGKATPFPISSESYHEAKVGAVSTLVVETTSDKAIAFPLGTYCTWRGEKFALFTPAEVVKVSEREYRYTLTLSGEGQQLALSKFKFIVANPEDVRLSFTLTGKPRFFLEQILRSLPAGFSIGACLEAEAQAISFKHEDCLSALSRVAEAFKTEWHITGKTLNLGKVVGNKADAVTLSYGKGKGLLSGLTASNDSEKSPVGKLFIQGTERNIDPSKYGAKSLHLPKGRTLAYEGRTYVVSDDGQSLSVSGLSTDGRKEDSFDGTNIYPQRVGVVSSVVVTPEGNYDIVDKDNNVDYSQYRIAGEKATITFQTGRLAGRTFDIAQDKDVLKYDHATKRFQLVSVEEDGMKLPEPKVFYPAVGDKYAVFGVRLPDEYITKAETELLNASVRYFHEALQPKVTYKAELDGLYAQKNWGTLAPKLAIGAYVRLVDTSLDIDDHVRITAIRTKLSQQYKPQITLSNEVQAPSLAVSLGTLEAEGVQQKEEVQAVRREVARSFQQAMSLADGIADEVRAGFGDSISPVTARTMQLMVGDKSLQFVFVASPTATGAVTHNVTWDESRGILHADRGYLRHMTLGINTLSSEHKPSEYKTWTLPAYDYAVRTDQKTIHLYAKVERNGANGVFFATDTAKAMEAEAGYYYLYLGMLSPAPNRAFTPLYGYTEVLPSQIRTERITSADGSTSINLNTGEIVSDKIKFRHPDGETKSYPSDYLHEAIHEGTTEIQGGLVLGSTIGAKDNMGAVVSYLSGTASLPAFACGVTGFGTDGYKAITELRHNGTGHIGAMHIDHGGRVITFKSEEKGSCDVRIGGAQSDLKDLLNKSFQDTLIVKGVAKKEISKPSFDTTVSKETIVQVSFSSQNDGAVFEFELPWDISIRHENSAANKINSFCKIQVSIVKSTGETVYDFSDYIKSGDNIVGIPSRINVPLKDSVRGLYAGSYTLSISVQVSSTLVSGAGYSGSPAFTRLVSQPFQMAYRVLGRNKDIKEAVFGRYGFSAFYGHDKLFYMQSDPKAGEKFLTIRGSVNMPGILLSGEFWVIGARDEIFSECTFGSLANGAIRCVRVDRGAYEIHHNLGYDNYTVQITPMWRPGYDSSNRVMARMEGKGENSFKVITAVAGEKNNYVPFSVLVLGNNFKQ